jgi:nucleoside-diphosphate-sugar epimerase
MQTILGSGGAVGIPLARELHNYDARIRLVSRNPQKINETDELFSADLGDKRQIHDAISGSDVVYVTIGFRYNLNVWQKTWPPFMKTVIEACKKYNARLVFFDNVYMYDKSAIPFMTESSPVNPPSKKGKIRAMLHEMILSEAGKGGFHALIARSADFYGPNNDNSILKIMVADNFAKGKKAQAFGNVHKVHTYTYTPDAAKATALLGNTADAYDQVWHVPTTREQLTSYEWISLIASAMNREVSIQTVPKWMIQAMGVFIPIMKELPEMMYQNELDYVFNSSKFEKRFGINPVSPEAGIKEMIRSTYPMITTM